MERDITPNRLGQHLVRWACVACLLLGLVVLLYPLAARPTKVAAPPTTTAEDALEIAFVSGDLKSSGTPPRESRSGSPRVGFLNIEQIRVGQRVFAHNPQVAESYRAAWEEPDWTQWRQLRMEMMQEDGSTLQITMIRPIVWQHVSAAQPGAEISLDLPEMGACGTAKVVAVSTCPTVQSGPGQVVTATFAHPPSTQVLDVTIGSADDGATSAASVAAGGSETIGVTDNHLFWSADRDDFVPIGEMAIGERVLTYHGDTKRVLAKLPRPGPQTVYNLEVYGEHTYYVGQSGVLVHNAYDVKNLDAYAETAFDAVFSSTKKGYSYDAVATAIKSKHGISHLTRKQYNEVMNHLRSTIFSDVSVTIINKKRYVDFGSWAHQGRTHHIPIDDLKPRTPGAKRSIDSLRDQHITDLNVSLGDMSGMTWHHMQVPGQFQRVDSRLHELFKGHRGLADWGL
jgi:hypothetical protein